MKKLLSYLPLALLLTACGGSKSYTVEVQNLSAKRFDSVHVFINNSVGEGPTAKFGTLLPGETMPPLAVGEIFGGGRSPKNTAMAIFYAADTLMRNSNLNKEAEGINNHYKITLDSGMQIKWVEPK